MLKLNFIYLKINIFYNVAASLNAEKKISGSIDRRFFWFNRKTI